MKTQLDDILPPHNKEAEESVLGSLLIDGSLIHDIRMVIKAEDFFSPETQWVFQACLNLTDRGEAIDQITVAHELASNKRLPEVGGASYLSHLIASVPTSLHGIYYSRVVKNLATRRRLISAGQQISALGYEETDVEKGISRSGDILLKVQKDMPHLYTPDDLAEMGINRYSELNKGLTPGVTSGFRELDRLTGGVFKGEYWVIAARPGIGKTELLLAMARHIGQNHGNVLLVSLEQKWGAVLDRLMATETGLSIYDIRDGCYTDSEYETIQVAVGKMSESKLYFYDSGGSVDTAGRSTASIYSVIRHMQMSYGVSVVLLDYLGLVNEGMIMNRYQLVTYVSGRIREMANDLNVPIICAAQLNRDVEDRETKKPELSDLRDSGAIEQDADVVVFLYRDDYYDDKRITDPQAPSYNIGKAEIIVAKQRQGGTGRPVSVPIMWDGKKRCYVDADKGKQGVLNE